MRRDYSLFVGKKFNKLVVIDVVGIKNIKGWEYSCFICKCDCGKYTTSRVYNIFHGTTKSCGCLKAEVLRRGREDNVKARWVHGMEHTPTYRSWKSMKSRCYHKSSGAYYKYGASGITVCERWRNSFVNFFADMGERPAKTTLDRIDGRKNYEPGNCRWATASEQNKNRRKFRRRTKKEIEGDRVKAVNDKLIEQGF